MINMTDKAAEALGEPNIAVVWRRTEEIAKELQRLKPIIEKCNEKSFLRGAIETLEDAHHIIMDVSIRCGVLLETGYRLLPPDARNHFE